MSSRRWCRWRSFAISGSVAILRVPEFVDVSVFALNLAVALSSNLAIDYSTAAR